MNSRATTLAIAAGCVLLTLIFLVAGFPYHRLESRIVRVIEAGVGGKMTYTEADTSFTFGIPGYEWRGVRITGASPRPLDFDTLATRPAFSAAWLRLVPAFHVDAVGKPGRAIGVVTLGDRPGFDGRLEQFELADLPMSFQPGAVTLRGVADAELDLAGGEQWIGDIDIEITSGSLTGGKFRLPLAFSKLTTQLQLVGDNRAEIASLHLEGPLLKADLVGSVGPGASLGAAPLDLALELDADPRAIPLLQPFGIRLTSRGPKSLKVTGTFDKPQVR